MFFSFSAHAKSNKRVDANGRSTLPIPSFRIFRHLQKQYQYDELEDNHIRLLLLEPGRRQDRIVCKLKAVNLLAYDDIGAEAPIKGFEHYEAISYVWGGTRRTIEIDCDGQKAYITKNLADALHTFRHSSNARVLWADAICINQNSIEERAKQVGLMGLIYWKAHRVCIWLGRDDNPKESHRAKDAIRVIKQLANIHSNALGSTAEDYKAYCGKIFEEPGSVTTSEWTALNHLLNRSWFQRVWVVQELGVARDAIFHCGDHCFTRTEIREFMSMLHRSKSHLIKPHNLNLQMLHLGNDYWRSCWGNTRLELGSDPKDAETFFDILDRARGLSCTDPRDCVYAFLGHPSAFKRHMLDIDPYHWYPRNYYCGRPVIISPNYAKKNTFLDVCSELAIAAIQNFGLGFSVLSHLAHNQETIQARFPSWVPRWDIGNQPTQFIGAEIYFAASGTLPETSFQLSSSCGSNTIDELTLKALRLDTIRCVRRAPVSESLMESMELMALLLSDATKMRRLSAIPIPNLLTYPYEEAFVLAFASTMTAGLTSSWQSYCEPSDELSSQHVRNFHAYYRRQQSLTSSALSDLAIEQAGYFTIDVKRESPGRLLYITHDGRFGLGPSVMEGSDEIWIPMGGKMPIILRPYDNGKYKIIGQTYLYGVMRGEAVHGKGEEDFMKVVLM